MPPTEIDEASAPPVDEEKEAAPRASGRRLLYVVTALAVAFGLVAGVMTAAYVRLRNDETGNDADRTEAATVAAQVAEAITSLDAQGPNEDQTARIRALGTGPLIEQYEDAIAAIQKTFAPLKVQSIRGQVTKVYMADVEGAQAEAMVVVDLVIVGDTPRVIPNQYLRIHLAHIDGVWKVDNVENLNVALAAQTGTPTTPPPSTESSSG